MEQRRHEGHLPSFLGMERTEGTEFRTCKQSGGVGAQARWVQRPSTESRSYFSNRTAQLPRERKEGKSTEKQVRQWIHTPTPLPPSPKLCLTQPSPTPHTPLTTPGRKSPSHSKVRSTRHHKWRGMSSPQREKQDPRVPGKGTLNSNLQRANQP